MTTWIMLRAAGIGSYIALWLAVSWGLIASTSLVTKRVSKPTSVMFHAVVGSAGLALLLVHLGGLLMDRFVPFGPLDLLIPMRATYHTAAVAFGIVAMYAVVVVLVSSWVRKHLTTKLWRTLHLLAVPAFALALAHGALAGSDSSRPWMFAVYVGTGLTTLFLVIVRGLTHGYRPPRETREPVTALRQKPIHPTP